MFQMRFKFVFCMFVAACNVYKLLFHVEAIENYDCKEQKKKRNTSWKASSAFCLFSRHKKKTCMCALLIHVFLVLVVNPKWELRKSKGAASCMSNFVCFSSQHLSTKWLPRYKCRAPQIENFKFIFFASCLKKEIPLFSSKLFPKNHTKTLNWIATTNTLPAASRLLFEILIRTVLTKPFCV